MENMANQEVCVSVVIPAYNGGKTIGKAIESALAQDVALEVIVINDCSRDNTEAIVEEYLHDPSVRYYANESNLGAAASRNRGVMLAHGKYVAFLDADDWWAEGKLKKQLELIEREQAVLCSTARELMYPDGRSMGKVISVKEKITYHDLLFHNSINCSSVLLLRDVAKEFPMEHEDSHEDYITWLKILKKYQYACAVNEPLLKYRLSQQGKSGSKWKSAKMTFKVYHYMGFGLAKSIFYFCCYAINGILKYR
jgi:teichuronic acid biosynthesis glycosyltransferase TuaG